MTSGRDRHRHNHFLFSGLRPVRRLNAGKTSSARVHIAGAFMQFSMEPVVI
ncbi:hypothetical protein [Pantoea vagans]|uniref:hypothetical protein n=1 Tax=Pantoea vagans TaxID=470934 RepID=UPI003B0260D0